MKIQVFSEIGRLRKVLVHRPGKEVERLYPQVFGELLFDDVMHIQVAQKEHDAFCDILKKQGIEVLYIEKLVAQILDDDPSLREQLVQDFIKDADVTDPILIDAISQYWLKIKNNLELVQSLIAGIQKNEVSPKWPNSLTSKVIQEDKYPFYINPIPNLLFQRDPLASIYNGFNINRMWAKTRQRESIFYIYLKKYHPEWQHIPINFDLKSDEGHIEGGDILVISPQTLFVGVSQRTNGPAIESLTKKIFAQYPKAKYVVGIEIPKERGSMHLDTVLTQMDYNKFSIDADMANLTYKIWELKRDSKNKIALKSYEIKILKLLQKFIRSDVKLAVVGGGDPIAAKREQWNDGANCLTIRPGVIITYDRNYITNALVSKMGVKVLEVPSSELSRGRGGPRCMSMPLFRDLIK